jgi:hypothetical protein
MSLTNGTKHCLFFRKLVNEIELRNPGIKVMCDNESTLKLSNNPESHSRTKHIALRFFFLRDLIEWKQVVTGKVESEHNPADLLTKHDDSFVRRRAMLGPTNKITSELQEMI